MAMKGFFDDLQTAEDLLRKLEWEYAQWQKDPLNAYVAWNFFVTAEHLPDWIAQADPRLPKDFPYKFRRKRPLLRICSHLANGGKHFIPGKHHKSVTSTYAQGGWVPEGWAPEGWAPLPALVVGLTPGEQRELMVALTPDEQRALSLSKGSIEARSLAAVVLAFWQQHLSGTSSL